MKMMLNWVFMLFILFVKRNDATVDNHPAWKTLPTKECGISRFTTRIVGGQETSLGAFPWMARLGYLKNSGTTFVCGGSLISSRFIISAAHCFSIKRNYLVRLGEHDFESEGDCDGLICSPPPQDIPLTGIYVHEYYNPQTQINDIAVAKMKNDAKLNDFVMPICLPQGPLQNASFAHTGQALTAGWGSVAAPFAYDSDVLMYVPLNFAEIRKCVEVYASVMTDHSQLCVGEGKGKDACDGDDGGPLMQPFTLLGDPRYFLIGIVSYGQNKCGLTPSIYTNVAFFLEWILDRII